MTKAFARVLATILFIYTAIRALYLFINRDFFFQESPTDILKALALGVRFDLSAIAMLSMASLVLIFFPLPFLHRKKFFRYLTRIIFCVVHSAGVLANLVDIEFVNTTGRRLSLSTLKDLGHDILPQAFQLVTSYALIMIFWAFFSYVIWRASARLARNNLSALANLATFFGAAVVLLFLARGGIQPKVLHPAHASSYLSSGVTADLALNGPFYLIRTPRAKKISVPKYFATMAEADRVLRGLPSQPSKAVLPPNTNVVLFIVESMGAEYMGDDGGVDYTPFLNELRRKSATFPAVANGTTSIQSLGPILLGIPSLLSNAYITSMYRSNRAFGIGSAFDSIGYDTFFFHGGKKGTMYFDAYAKIAGIKNYYGMEDDPIKEHFDGAWGIYDHYFLEFMANKLKNETKPFLSVLFTLSSHPPYRIPPEKQGTYPTGPLRIHESFGYVDESFRNFFQKHEGEAWFKNTLFVFTADHTQTPHNRKFFSVTGRRRIPIFFYHPSIDLSKYSSPTKVIEQADIAASIYDLLGKPRLEKCVLAKSAFDKNDPKGKAMFRTGACIHQVEGGPRLTYYRFCDDRAPEGPFDFLTDGSARTPLVAPSADQLNRAKAATQIFFDGLVNDHLFRKL